MADLPHRSRAAVVHAFGAPLSIEDVPVPTDLEPGSILVEIVAASMCGTDVHCWEGSLALRLGLPLILGHEMVGRIVAFGQDAEIDSVGQRLRLGDRIIFSHAFCGRCTMCTRKKPALCQNRLAYGYEPMTEPPYLLGGFARHAYVLPNSGRVLVPQTVPDELASMASCAVRSVVNAVEQAGRIDATDTVVVQGSGPLGILATGLFKAAGAGQVITIGAPAARLELAAAFGADHTLSIVDTPVAADRVGAVLAATDGLGADLVTEFSGHPAAFAEGLDMAAPGGRYVVVGQLGTGQAPVAPGTITKKNLTVIGSFSGDIGHYHKALLMLEKYRDTLPFDRIISGRYPLEEINTVLHRMQAFEEIKPVLYPG